MKMIPLDGRKTNTCSKCNEEKDISKFTIVQGRMFRLHICTTCRGKTYEKKPREVYISRKDRSY